jgi:hypothetical protein
MTRWSGWFRRHRGAVVTGLVVVVIAVVTFLAVRPGTEGVGRPKAAGGATTTAAPRGPNAEMLRLLEPARTASYEGRYTSSDASGTRSARLWRRPPQERLDTESGAGDDDRRSRTLTAPSGNVSCQEQGGGPWSCKNEPGRVSGGIGDILSGAVVARVSTLPLVARDDRIAGEPVRCFTVTGQPVELCLTTDGVLARLVAESTRLELTSLERRTPGDDVFVPPAPPTG